VVAADLGMSKRKQAPTGDLGVAEGKRRAEPDIIDASGDVAGEIPLEAALFGAEDESTGFDLGQLEGGDDVGDDVGVGDELDAEDLLAQAVGDGDREDSFADEPLDEPEPVDEPVDDALLPISVSDLESKSELDFREATVSAAQARRMAALIATNDSLTTITFSGHELSITDLKEEDELEWDSEEISDVEAIIIAELLRANTKLERLDLARNEISDEGAAALANMLHENSTLEYVNLDSNSISEKGGKAFCRAVSANSTLQYLNLMNNAIPSSYQARLRHTWTAGRESMMGLHL